MNDRGKIDVEVYNHGGEEYYGEHFLEFPCKKHPNSSSTSSGICAYCLTDKLYQLVCPQCGEQMPCSCSCSNNFSSNPNSSSFTNMGYGGRTSFSVENDNINGEFLRAKANMERKTASYLRRSNSTCVVDVNPTIEKKDAKEKFWKIGRLFRKKREKTNNNDQEDNYECSNNRVSRSRSISNFRGSYDTQQESGNFPVSSFDARPSNVSTGNFFADSAKMSCFSESEARFSNFDCLDATGFNKNPNYNYNSNNNYNYNYNNNYNNSSLRENEFMNCDDPAYIDLKLHDVPSSASDRNSNKVPNLASLRKTRLNQSTKEYNSRGNDHVFGKEMLRNGSCRRSSVTESELRKCKKSSKVWKWFSKDQTSSRGNYEDPHGFNS